MTAPLPESGKVAERMDVIALGPGLGSAPELVALTRVLVAQSKKPMVIDADGLNALAGSDWSSGGNLRVLKRRIPERCRGSWKDGSRDRSGPRRRREVAGNGEKSFALCSRASAASSRFPIAGSG